jgi:Zn-dependent peptidase ImmA (M78 family)
MEENLPEGFGEVLLTSLEVDENGIRIIHNHIMLLSSFRPLGRRVFNCGHELGHHLFGHGSTLDELQEEHQATGNSNPKEFLVNAFAGFLLMPPNAVRRAFTDRQWTAAEATPE